MGIVTEITALDSKRFKIFIDHEFAFVLYKGELSKYQIKQAEEIREEIRREIEEELLPTRAKKRVMNLLVKKEYTEKQLRDKLSEGGYPQKSMEEAIDYVKSYVYVNDKRYAENYHKSYEYRKPYGKIREELMKRGISKVILEELDASVYEERVSRKDEEEELARMYLSKKHYHPGQADYKEKRRMYEFLMRKGFSRDVIRKALIIDEEICEN